MSADDNTERPGELVEDRDELKEKRKELLKETDRIKLMLDTSIENGLFETYAKKTKAEGVAEAIKSLFKKFLSIIKKTDKKNEEKNGKEDKKNEEKNGKEDKKNEELDKEILDQLQKARKSLIDKKFSEDRLAESEDFLLLAKKAYSKALYSAPLSWRFFNEYAGHIWIWLIGLLTIVFFIFYYQDNFGLENNLKVGGAAISAVAWGIIGAVLRAMWFLKEKVDERGYRKSWNAFFISVPFLGGILAAIVYLILFAGLFALTNNIDNTQNVSPVGSTINITNTTTSGNATGTTGNMTTTPIITTSGNATGTTGNMTTTPITTVITNTTTITPADTTTEERDLIDPLTIIPFAALAGFKWEWAIRIFRGIGERIR